MKEKNLILFLFYYSHFVKALSAPDLFDFNNKSEEKNKYKFKDISVKSRIATNDFSFKEDDLSLRGNYRTIEEKKECTYDDFALFDDISATLSTKGSFETKVSKGDKELVFKTEFDGFKEVFGLNIDNSSSYDAMLITDKKVNSIMNYIEGEVTDYYKIDGTKCYHTSSISDEVDIIDISIINEQQLIRTLEEMYPKRELRLILLDFKKIIGEITDNRTIKEEPEKKKPREYKKNKKVIEEQRAKRLIKKAKKAKKNSKR